MKVVSGILLILISAFCSSCTSTNKKTKPLLFINPDVAQEGALASDRLIQNISTAMTQTMGEPEKPIEKFVLQPPVGNQGEKIWRELWIFTSEGATVQFVITFREDGQGATNFEIRSM